MFPLRTALLVLAAAAGHVLIVANAPAAKPADKLLILVDKVLMKETRPEMTPAQMQEIKEAGFTVVVPRWGGNDMAALRRNAELSQAEGLAFMPWFRCTGYTEEDHRKMVWRDGTVQAKLYSPNDDEFWEKFTGTVLGHVRLSIENPAVIGTFLDFENYDKVGSRGQCYSLSYDNAILTRFGEARGASIPELPPADRYPWLVEQGLHDAFAAHQLESWRARCRAIRAQIDAINPRYRLAVYPAPGTLFIKEAVYPAWGTDQAPLIFADASVYARSLPFVREKPSLEGNRRKILDHIAFVKGHGFPFSYVGGLDPILEMDNPEFVGKNAEMLALVTDGYWVFYEGPTYGETDHEQFFRWFRKANESIRAGSFRLHQEPRHAAENLGPDRIERNNMRPLVLHEGVNIVLHKALAAHRLPSGNAAYDVRFLESMKPAYLRDADALILQNSTRWRPADHNMRQSIRGFVEEGGGVFVTHLGWKRRGCIHPDRTDGEIVVDIHDPVVEGLFPEVATWCRVTNPSSDGWRVFDLPMEVAADHPAAHALKKGDRFETDSPNHMVLKPGRQGMTVLCNVFGDAVCVVGNVGEGRVALSGCVYGFASPTHPFRFQGKEREFFCSILQWLAKPEQKHAE